MKVEIEVPVFAYAAHVRPGGRLRETLASVKRRYDLPEVDGEDVRHFVSYLEYPDHDEGDAERPSTEFHMLDGIAHRLAAPLLASGEVYRLTLGRGLEHPFFANVAPAFRKRLAEAAHMGASVVDAEFAPRSVVAAIRSKEWNGYEVETIDAVKMRWQDDGVEKAIEAFDAWIARFAVAGGQLYVREEAPFLRVSGLLADPEINVEIVPAGEQAKVEDMNRSEGFNPYCVGYFPLSEYDEAAGLAFRLGRGTAPELLVAVRRADDGASSDGFKHMSLLDMAIGMRKTFARTIAPGSEARTMDFDLVDRGLAALPIKALTLYAALSEGIRTSSERSVSRSLEDAFAAILASDVLSHFFWSDHHLAAAQFAFDRFARRTLMIADAVLPA